MTVLRLSTHLWFDSRALEAAELYTGLLPDSRIDRVVAAPPGVPGAQQGSPFIVDLTLMGSAYTFLNGGPLFAFDAQVSISVLVDTQEELDRYWAALTADGGRESRCGWLVDRFGLSWQIVPEALDRLMSGDDPAAVARVTAEMLTQTKLDVAALERAAS